jgi:2-octaprenyl-6-methoxyphenol hydroxylase
MSDRSDVIILGGGMVGLALAAALDASGLTSVLIDPADPDERGELAFDGRTTAVSSSSMRMFGTVGITAFLPVAGHPIGAIRVADGLAPGGLTFQPEASGEPLGQMHENRHLRSGLRARAESGSGIDLRWNTSPVAIDRGEHRVTVTTSTGDTLTAPLLVAADGRHSPVREAAGIRMAQWRYDHAAIVTTLLHDRPHDDVAYEIFYPGGPFALLPMGDGDGGRHRSALVWTVPSGDAAGWMSLSDSDFAAEARVAMGGFLGEIALAAPRSSYPLGFHHAHRITDHRLALVGDAAHAIHPIAGQGVNLGFRDVAALAQVLVEGARLGLDLGDRQLTDRYERWRSLDTLMVSMSTDSLVRLYGIPGRTASAVRRLGMRAIDRLGPIKARLNSEARGTSGDLPLLLRGIAV